MTTTAPKPTTAKIVRAPKQTQECPIFLRKTYHMVDTCKAEIACWSEDGETFVVKNTDVFEKTVIPQFFKHSKFSSFVRQLNFYGFRKIKYADTIKIDAKLEAETANFWRFRHEKFQRGKPELLIEIKRSNGQQQMQTGAAAAPAATAAVTPAQKKQDVGSLKTEVTCLKKRIEAMTKNIDDLTSLVSKVTIASAATPKPQPQQPENKVSPTVSTPSPTNTVNEPETKRPKTVTEAQIRPESVISAPMDVDSDIKFTPSTLFSEGGSSSSIKRESFQSAQLSDDAFVDQLFTAFGNEDPLDLEETLVSTTEEKQLTSFDNRPDPALMDKLSDALTVVPKQVQEMIIERLVNSITSSESMSKNLEAASALSEAAKIDASNVIETVEQEATTSAAVLEVPKESQQQQVAAAMPLAAATLAAMLSQYGSHAKDGKIVGIQTKSLPIIPIHA
mmetsp:Transcript_447/g.667  ORF Transcript_447/g.667 Transcript_447/m.667 type:complete len:448 (+) Transcript_447:159-1502(+)|eukprot:CAMPEP_0195301068 /NCGR_PEP_ID=MMETSP0707-20130614/28683_1 /TAXON_ID=33640 /ORGANISM="Asterionellopsis glacialis, Strain CCMP134" /LENGTH=447 /DNA_ID=CAMNT_0040363923 /DNA_START=155 /DNA_END=1498 /DNA_ORIENTATION=-